MSVHQEQQAAERGCWRFGHKLVPAENSSENVVTTFRHPETLGGDVLHNELATKVSGIQEPDPRSQFAARKLSARKALLNRRRELLRPIKFLCPLHFF